jgi:hypothetical protein
MEGLNNLVKNEPVLISGLIQAILGLLLAFGISVSDEQIGAIMAATAIVLAILARIFVTPTHQIPEPAPEPPGPTVL